MSDNGDEKKQAQSPPIVANIAIEPTTGQLLIAVADVITDKAAFAISVIGVCAQFLQQQHMEAKRPTIEVPKLVLPRSKRGAP
jgi:hypothetical protein